MGIFDVPSAADDWYEDVEQLRFSDDPEDQAIGQLMDECPNNPRFGGPGYFDDDPSLDRR